MILFLFFVYVELFVYIFLQITIIYMVAYYRPLELEKLCCNVIIKQIYNEYEYFFIKNMKQLNLPDTINNSIIDRYKIIKFILNNE